MLSNQDEPVYQRFLECLYQLLKLSTTEPAPEELIRACRLVEEVFMTEVVGLMLQESGYSRGQAWQSIQTEMHKEIKLLVTEITFYQICRSPFTKSQRKQMIGDRAQTLIQYCHWLLGTSE